MNLRLAASLVFVGTLAYACGPQSRADLAAGDTPAATPRVMLASMGGNVPRVGNTVEKTVKSRSATLSTKFDVAQSGDDVRFEFRIVNTTAKPVEVTFPNGQAYDFVVVDSVGREVWRWAEGRIFTQSVQNKLLAKGEAISVSEKWSSAKPGKFTAIAVLNSKNYPVEQKVEFERR